MGKKTNRKFAIGDNVTSMDQARQHCKKTFKPTDLIDFKRYPLTDPQKQFIEAYEDNVPLIVQAGSAGSGKTACAIFCALSEVFEGGSPYDHVKIVRSCSQTREIGHTPGTAEEKLDVYSTAYRQICDELLCYNSNNYDNLQSLGYLSFESTSFLRGQTWDNTVVILDEFQNCTFHELLSVISRLGNYSKIILCGDHNQTDLWKKNDQSGFHQLMKVLDRMDEDDSEVVYYTTDHIVRSGVVKSFLEAVYSE